MLYYMYELHQNSISWFFAFETNSTGSLNCTVFEFQSTVKYLNALSAISSMKLWLMLILVKYMFLKASRWTSEIWFSAKSMVSMKRRSANIWNSTFVSWFRAKSTVPTLKKRRNILFFVSKDFFREKKVHFYVLGIYLSDLE